MGYMNALSSSLSNISTQSDELDDTISAVLIHIRCQELRQQKRRHILLSIALARAVGLVIGIGRFVAYPVFHPIRFTIAVSVAAFGAYGAETFGAPSYLGAVYGYLLGYVLSDPKRSIEAAREVVFDAVDFLSLGTLSLLFSRILDEGQEYFVRLSLRHRRSALLPEPLAVHLYTSRIPFQRDKELKPLEQELLDLSSRTTDNASLYTWCDRYWGCTDDNYRRDKP